MEQIITVTNNWQIHIPILARKKLGLKKPGLLKATVEKNKLVLTPKKSSLLSLGGSLKKTYQKNPINLEKIRDYIDYSQA